MNAPDTSPQVSRSFGQKYKAEDYAHYYSGKHDSSLARRVSTHFERAMIRRALNRIRRHRRFESVLDCPSGTGRFLPTLAGFGVGVVAMDTSDHMLAAGRRFHDQFGQSPTVAAGSALELPLSDNSVDVVLCARLLHHIPERDNRLKILQEFARVARVGVVVSFFDAASYRAWKRQRKSQKRGQRGGRHAMPRNEVVEEAQSAGLKPLGMNAMLRFHTEITAAAFAV